MCCPVRPRVACNRSHHRLCSQRSTQSRNCSPPPNIPPGGVVFFCARVGGVGSASPNTISKAPAITNLTTEMHLFSCHCKPADLIVSTKHAKLATAIRTNQSSWEERKITLAEMRLHGRCNRLTARNPAYVSRLARTRGTINEFAVDRCLKEWLLICSS